MGEISLTNILNNDGEPDFRKSVESDTLEKITKQFPQIQTYKKPVTFKWNGNIMDVELNGLPEDLSAEIKAFLNE